jgi:hypothetical protein
MRGVVASAIRSARRASARHVRVTREAVEIAREPAAGAAMQRVDLSHRIPRLPSIQG